MEKYTKHLRAARGLMIILPVIVAALMLANLIMIRQFNEEIHTVDGVSDQGETTFAIVPRGGSTSTWDKKDYDLNGETVTLKAQTYDGELYSSSGYKMTDWTLTLRAKGDCFINNAWCGTVEIHQNTGTDEEKVQTLDLRDFEEADVTLEHTYDSDLLLPLHEGDYVVYHPSEKDNETPVSEKTRVSFGFILYYLEEPDLSDFTVTYRYQRSFTDSWLFGIGAAFAVVWLLLADSLVLVNITYRMAIRDMELKKSGVSAMSDIYSIIYIVDLKKNELIPVVSDKESEKLRPKELKANEQLRQLFTWDCNEIYRDMVLDFCDLETVRERMGGRNTIVCEYVSRHYGWCQLRFFAMDQDPAAGSDHLIFTIQVIDEEKSQLEALNAEVQEKTENIIDMQQKIVVGMANIIENRDDNTGGHVKRTSDVISIIVNEIRSQGLIRLDSEKARDIVRAAPMHDIGKIVIDSSILCKPGRLTDEEFAVMKTHSSKSGEMVKLLLEGVEEEHFVDTAFHIARSHHERWDGRGYPDGLKGEAIPIEARIMAIADVYDALVSERCYKKPMSFEKAYEIMIEGMGTQFDPGLKEVFEKCSKELEAYYRNNR